MPLNGRAVLVTRPKAQGEALCAEIAHNGGLPIHVPMLGIRALPSPIDCTKPDKLHGYAIVIFISRNAVLHGLEQLGSTNVELGSRILIAVGPSTAQSLKRSGYSEVLCPAEQFSSAGVIQLDALQKKQINGAKILIIRGFGGRETLADTLRRRGATVDYWEVYERFLPNIAIAESLKAAAVDAPDIGIVTSLQSLKNLSSAINNEGLDNLYAMPLIVVSKRIANEVTKVGFTNPAFIVDNPDDATMIKTLTRWAIDRL
jgi:uroporphyrinogen-III synthase